jgi:tetratricopeptide (TPR) repeat protein
MPNSINLLALHRPVFLNKPLQNNERNMLGLRTTIYKVGDIQKATEWYSKAFEINPYFKEPYYVGFNIKGYELGLQPEETPTLDKPESVVSYWGVENIQEL